MAGVIRCLAIVSSVTIVVIIVLATQLASSSNTTYKGVVIALSIICFGCLCALAYKLIQCRRLNKCSDVEKAGAIGGLAAELEKDEDNIDDELLQALSGVPAMLNLKELENATGGFCKLLGKGGFGSVYEGELPDGTKIAVKKLETEGKLRSKEFCAEVVTISGIHHVNLVRLLGFCAEGSHRLLVYEFMQNGSLDKWLFQKQGVKKKKVVSDMRSSLDKADHGLCEEDEVQVKDGDIDNDNEDGLKAPHLSWMVRFRIALETARALAYLHEECRERILHLDVKPQNILLDEKFHAKVSDFGLSRAIAREQSRLVTSNMRGTPGYLAPEWLVHAGVTDRSDVYSYGMVLLELVSGRRNVDHSAGSDAWYFPGLAFHHAREQHMEDIVDPALRHNGGMLAADMVQAQLAIRVAFWCIQDHVGSRPTMSSVVRMLEGTVPVSDPPLTGVFSFTNVLVLGGGMGIAPNFHQQEQEQRQQEQEHIVLNHHAPPHILHIEEPFSISIDSSTLESPLPPPPCR